MRAAHQLLLRAGVLVSWMCVAGACASSRPAEPVKVVEPYEPPDDRIVFFARGRADITAPDGFFALGYVAALLDADPRLHVLIIGHASREGSASYARQLSFRRARSARKVLSTHGVEPRRMLLGVPRQQPRADRPALNQRVDVYVYDPLKDEISQRLGYEVELRGE